MSDLPLLEGGKLLTWHGPNRFCGYLGVKPTGGSVNGSILEAQKNLAFSKERYLTAWYDGPYAARLKNVSIAGAGE